MILAQYGYEEATGDGYKLVTSFSKEAYAYSYGIKNTKDEPIEVLIDLSSSENMSFSSSGP